MTRKLLCGSSLLLVVLTLISASPAQDTQRFEAFGGYSFSYHPSFPIVSNYSFNGWNGSSTVFVNRWFGLTADFSGSYGSQKVPIFCEPGQCLYEKASLSSYTYLFGPHLVYRHRRYAPFVETLVGLHNPHLSTTLLNPSGCNCQLDYPSSASYHKFAFAVGGGLDVALSHGVSIRPFEVDYLLLREPAITVENNNLVYYGTNNNTFRYSGGISFRFGQHLGPVK
jgi:Outer membrane protein beta-barrel domain